MRSAPRASAWPAPTSSSAATRSSPAGKETVLRMRAGRTRVALNAHSTPTAAFVKNANWATRPKPAPPRSRRRWARRPRRLRCRRGRDQADGRQHLHQPDDAGLRLAEGLGPAGARVAAARDRAQRVAVDNNKAAFEWGRRAAHDPASVAALLAPAQVIEFKKRETLESADRAPRRVPHRLPERRLRRRATRPSSSACAPPKRRWASRRLTEAVARYLFKLMAYKDEYEVARLHTETGFQRAHRGAVRGRLQAPLPPGAAALAKPQRQGRAAEAASSARDAHRLPVLARLKGLRGTALDVFGRTEERRTERALIADYRASIEEVLRGAGRGQPCAGRGDRADPRADQGLRPREGAQPGRRAPAVGRS